MSPQTYPNMTSNPSPDPHLTYVLQNAGHGQGPFGAGHGCFMHFGSETLAPFHATEEDTDGSWGRRCREQRVEWGDEAPYTGDVVGESTRHVEVFSRDAGLSLT